MQDFPTSTPIPPHHGPPASAEPITNLVHQHPHLVPDNDYVVLPRQLVENMELRWQQQLAGLLEYFARSYEHVTWPEYHVLATRPAALTDLSEEQLDKQGILAELDTNGELVYRNQHTLEKIEHPEQHTVRVPYRDPLVPREN